MSGRYLWWKNSLTLRKKYTIYLIVHVFLDMFLFYDSVHICFISLIGVFFRENEKCPWNTFLAIFEIFYGYLFAFYVRNLSIWLFHAHFFLRVLFSIFFTGWKFCFIGADLREVMLFTGKFGWIFHGYLFCIHGWNFTKFFTGIFSFHVFFFEVFSYFLTPNIFFTGTFSLFFHGCVFFHREKKHCPW